MKEDYIMEVKIYIDRAQRPFCTFQSEGGELLKHDIAAHLLLIDRCDMSKIRIVINHG